jgi:hypothetical protein
VVDVRRRRATGVEVPAELARFDLERWATDEPAPSWWTDDPATGSWRHFTARLAWQEARRRWVRAQPDRDAAIDALHPDRSERAIVTAMYGRR